MLQTQHPLSQRSREMAERPKDKTMGGMRTAVNNSIDSNQGEGRTEISMDVLVLLLVFSVIQ